VGKKEGRGKEREGRKAPADDGDDAWFLAVHCLNRLTPRGKEEKGRGGRGGEGVSVAASSRRRPGVDPHATVRKKKERKEGRGTEGGVPREGVPVNIDEFLLSLF